jgi:hypothetical protein
MSKVSGEGRCSYRSVGGGERTDPKLLVPVCWGREPVKCQRLVGRGVACTGLLGEGALLNVKG